MAGFKFHILYPYGMFTYFYSGGTHQPLSGRGDRIRICDLSIPNAARYQLRHAPIFFRLHAPEMHFCAFYLLSHFGFNIHWIKSSYVYLHQFSPLIAASTLRLISMPTVSKTVFSLFSRKTRTSPTDKDFRNNYLNQ